MASGAIAGHLVATSIAILGGAFLANYISEKMVSAITVLLAIKNQILHFDFCATHSILNQVGYLGGVLFLVFAMATLFGVF